MIADPDDAATLPAAELAAGYAEVVKTALIAGGGLWERVRAGADPATPRLIAACAQTKLRIVAADERDGGVRQVLNLGHTVAHAIETVDRLCALSPRRGGRPGCSPAAAVGAGDLRDEVRGLLAARGLPTSSTAPTPTRS